VSVATAFPVLGVQVAAADMPGVVATVAEHVRERRPGYICASNVHSVMVAWRDPDFRRVLNEASLTVPDGVPLVWMGRLQGHPGVRRVYGPDLTVALAAESARRGWSCFFYGGAPGAAEDLAAELVRRHPALRVAGCAAPPFRALSEEEDAADVARLNGSGADIVFVGLGCPKQEIWMAAHRGGLAAPVLVGVGAAFDFLTGRKPQAPRFLMRLGLEWLFRLLSEPRRLAARYVVNNPLFVLLALRQLARQRLTRRS
jgi:N-acetylglucosaminyldiphosphoundecaprenol N-acetyl-beta-D-mannosaminyltransferase